MRQCVILMRGLLSTWRRALGNSSEDATERAFACTKSMKVCWKRLAQRRLERFSTAYDSMILRAVEQIDIARRPTTKPIQVPEAEPRQVRLLWTVPDNRYRQRAADRSGIEDQRAGWPNAQWHEVLADQLDFDVLRRRVVEHFLRQF